MVAMGAILRWAGRTGTRDDFTGERGQSDTAWCHARILTGFKEHSRGTRIKVKAVDHYDNQVCRQMG